MSEQKVGGLLPEKFGRAVVFLRQPRFIVFVVTMLAYIPMSVGGWLHPEEINIASWELWIILSLFFAWSARAQGYSAWLMQLGWVIGNSFLVGLMFFRGGYTFNLGNAETITLFGLVVTIGFWAIHGLATGKQNPAILYLGCVITDMLSFYPLMKQYWGPNDAPSWWTLVGWIIALTAITINLFFAEQFGKKLRTGKKEYEKVYGTRKSAKDIFQESLLSMEQGILILATMSLMTW